MNTMVTLRNIQRNNDVLKADYYPENDQSRKGYMAVQVSSGLILEHRIGSLFSAPHVKNELIKLSRVKELPNEKTVFWY